jgi:hypothetical protein
MNRKESKVITQYGNPVLLIGDEAFSSCAYMTYFEERNDYSLFAQKGYRIYTVSVSLAAQPINTFSGFAPFHTGIFDTKGTVDFTETDEAIHKILEACPELYSMPTDIAWDYVYSRESLSTLKGKKLHGKRNHINKFLSKYPDYEYKRLTPEMVEDCIALYDKWIMEKDEETAKTLQTEKRSVLRALNNMEELDLIGGTIFIDNKLCAFTVGERLHPHMQLIHIEKGDTDYEGIFPMINQQYVLHECSDVELINREEDMGVEGMRKAKRSYQPIKMIEKHLISVKDLTNVKGIWGHDDE